MLACFGATSKHKRIENKKAPVNTKMEPPGIETDSEKGNEAKRHVRHRQKTAPSISRDQTLRHVQLGQKSTARWKTIDDITEERRQ